MSDVSEGPDWWQASDGKWYSPGMHPDNRPGPVPKKRRTGLIIAGSIVGVIVLLAIIGAATGSKSKNVSSTATTVTPVATTRPVATTAPAATTRPLVTTTTIPQTTTTAPPSGPGFNQVAKDGSFAFTVTGMQCGVTTVGDSGFTKDAPAGSQWCLVTMNVANDKSSGQTFFATNQKAVDAQGRQLDADSEALIYMANGSASEIAQINPGISVTATVPFQLSSSDSIKSFELHDSAFSGGVTVRAS